MSWEQKVKVLLNQQELRRMIPGRLGHFLPGLLSSLRATQCTPGYKYCCSHPLLRSWTGLSELTSKSRSFDQLTYLEHSFVPRLTGNNDEWRNFSLERLKTHSELNPLLGYCYREIEWTVCMGVDFSITLQPHLNLFNLSASGSSEEHNQLELTVAISTTSDMWSEFNGLRNTAQSVSSTWRLFR